MKTHRPSIPSFRSCTSEGDCPGSCTAFLLTRREAKVAVAAAPPFGLPEAGQAISLRLVPRQVRSEVQLRNEERNASCNSALRKPDAGNLHVRFDEGGGNGHWLRCLSTRAPAYSTVKIPPKGNRGRYKCNFSSIEPMET